MQFVTVTIRYGWETEKRAFGPFEDDAAAIAFIAEARKNKRVIEALRDNMDPPSNLVDFLPAD